MNPLTKNCRVYSNDPDLVGKLVMHGYTVQFESELPDSLADIGTDMTNLLILDRIENPDREIVHGLIRTYARTIIRGDMDITEMLGSEVGKVIALRAGDSNDTLIEKIVHLDTDIKNDGAPQKKVLIIEDNVDIVEMYELAFRSRGYAVTRALDGLTGVTKAVSIRPDVIILDIMMPNMDGFEVLQALRNNTTLKTLIVTNSNLEGVDEEKTVKALGSDYFLRKSEYTPLDVVSFIEDILRKSGEKIS